MSAARYLKRVLRKILAFGFPHTARKYLNESVPSSRKIRPDCSREISQGIVKGKIIEPDGPVEFTEYNLPMPKPKLRAL